MNNSGGALTSDGALTLSTGTLDNTDGTLLARRDLGLQVSSATNLRGQMGSLEGGLTLHAQGAVDNTQGRLLAAQSLQIESGLSGTGRLINRQGEVAAEQVDVDSHGQSVDNTQGRLLASRQLQVRSASLDNSGGLLQSGEGLVLQAQGDVINARDTGWNSPQGIHAGGSLTLGAMQLTNGSGVSAGSEATLLLASLTNRAELAAVGSMQLTVAGQADNQSGQIKALQSLALRAGQILNQGGLIYGGQSTDLGSAGNIDNRDTRASDLGIQGGSIQISSQNLDNTQGQILANQALTLTVSQSLLNDRGQLSSQGRLVIQEGAGQPQASTLQVSNATGRMWGAEGLVLSAKELGAGGRLASGRDLSLTVAGDLTMDGSTELAAQGAVALNAGGAFTNAGRLNLMGNLDISSATFSNLSGAELSAARTTITSTGALRNQGLIDGDVVTLNAAQIVNEGTGRIYGGDIALSGGSLSNGALSGTSATIAARSSLTGRFTQSVSNTGGGLIFADGAMSLQAASLLNENASIEASRGLILNISGEAVNRSVYTDGELAAITAAGGPTSALLDTRAFISSGGGASITAGRLINSGATIDVRGNLELASADIRNLNPYLQWQLVNGASTSGFEFGLIGNTVRYKPEDIRIVWSPDKVRDGWLGYWSSLAQSSLVPFIAAFEPGRDNWSADTYNRKLVLDSERYPFAVFGRYLGNFSGGEYFVRQSSDYYGLPPGCSRIIDCDLVLLPGAHYAADDRIWSDFKVTPGDDAALDAAIQAFYNDLASRSYGDFMAYEFTRKTQQAQVSRSLAGRIVVGGSLFVQGGQITNEMSQIVGRDGVAITGSSVRNVAYTVTVNEVESGAAYRSYNAGSGNPNRGIGYAAYTDSVSRTVTLELPTLGSSGSGGAGVRPQDRSDGTAVTGDGSGQTQLVRNAAQGEASVLHAAQAGSGGAVDAVDAAAGLAPSGGALAAWRNASSGTARSVEAADAVTPSAAARAAWHRADTETSQSAVAAGAVNANTSARAAWHSADLAWGQSPQATDGVNADASARASQRSSDITSAQTAQGANAVNAGATARTDWRSAGGGSAQRAQAAGAVTSSSSAQATWRAASPGAAELADSAQGATLQLSAEAAWHTASSPEVRSPTVRVDDREVGVRAEQAAITRQQNQVVEQAQEGGAPTRVAVDPRSAASAQRVKLSDPGLAGPLVPNPTTAISTSAAARMIAGQSVHAATPNLQLPGNSLFKVHREPGSRYLVETDARFADYRQWLSSDYLISALSYDPATVQKRLGDGYYEQRLVREQIGQLTGSRYLAGYDSDEASYRALMQAGASFAKSHQLTPGVALSAEQMAQLTTDLVWLVEQSVTLADGSTQRVLVPQVYLLPRDGDLTAQGALIGGDRVSLALSGDLDNSANIEGTKSVAVQANNINNTGSVRGASVALSALQDLKNLGGQIAADDTLSLSAGRDIAVESSMASGQTATNQRTVLDRVAQLQAGGVMLVQAGRDVTLRAAQLNQGNDAAPLGGQGGVLIQAGRDLQLSTVQTASSQQLRFDADNYRNTAQQQDVGTAIQAKGSIALQAGQDLTLKAASVNAQAAVELKAGRDLQLLAGQAQEHIEDAAKHTHKEFLSRTTTTSYLNQTQSTALGSTISGQTVDIGAARDMVVLASNVVSDEGTKLVAGRDLTLGTQTLDNHRASSSSRAQSGIFSSGAGVSIGKQSQSQSEQRQVTEQIGSQIGSLTGDVILGAGRQATLSASQVLTPQGSVDIQAQKVLIQAATETASGHEEQHFKQSGLSVSLSSPVISALQGVAQAVEGGAKTSDPRMKALAAAQAALSVKDAVSSVQTLAKNPSAGVGFNISLGSSRSDSQTDTASTTAVGSKIAAGGNVSIKATGAGADSTLAVIGSDVSAGGKASLKADGAIQLEAAKNTLEQHSQNSGKSGSVGIGINMGGSHNGVSLNASVSQSQGRADGSDTTWAQTRVSGAQVSLESGGDTTLKGASVTAKQVQARVGGDLNIQSLQDTSQYDAKQQSAGAGVSVCLPPLCYGASSVNASVSSAKVKGDFVSVSEQSGIKAGDGGFQLEVRGNTDLKGGVISSSQRAIEQGKNSLQTASLTASDLQNRDDYKASGYGVSGGLSSKLGDQSSAQALGQMSEADKAAAKAGEKNAGPNVAPGLGRASGSQGSVTQSGVSGAVITITNEAQQKALTGQDAATAVASLKREVTSEKDGSGALKKAWDGAQLMGEVQAQVQITQQALPRLAREIGDRMGSQAEALREKARGLPDTDPNKKKLQDEAAKYDEGGAYRVAAHAVLGGLAGGVGGALGAGGSAAAAQPLNELQAELQSQLANAGMGAEAAQGLAKLVTGAGAGLVGGALGGTAGAVVGANADFNNRQLHPQERNLIEKLAKDKAARACKPGDTDCVTSQTRFWTDTLERVANGLVDDKANAENMAYLAQLAKASSDPNSEGARGLLQNYVDALKTAQGMLTPYMGRTVTVNGQTATADGSPQTYFSATAAQKADPYGNYFLGSKPDSIAPLKNLRDEERVERLGALNGAAKPDYTAEELLLGGKVAEKAIGVAGKLLGSESDVALAGTVEASRGGNISASKVTNEGMPAKLTQAEANLLKQLDTLPTTQAQGTLREYVADNYYLRNGYTSLDGKCGSNCFDGVYLKDGKLFINEVKPLNADGSIKLSGPSGTLPTQMDRAWIESRAKELANGTPSQREVGNLILKAMEPGGGGVTPIVTGVNSSGITVVKLPEIKL
ncbi:hemagglutinin repeat-containing protein [Pelomonas sp. CA6]|uniref:hemagglutinin repeat-containing protein n=1 Tax=Pelomonas sp. CA6 TaxID=2907999 RepID=UPI001F4C22D6|nr:hemagglutinin repeat-containing protein [Pelomonas sp. CA6]MCH7344727.1 hemagglutinin repeat-containing protein [Pelomonas sp. CA6]